MNELTIFNNPLFGEVRTIQDGEKILFCGSDVAKILGYTNPPKAINDHCRAITKRSTHISGKMQGINFISEGDVYRLITSSKLPTAEKFEKWVFDEVLPTIRKHGLYAKDELLDNPDLLIEIAIKLKEEKTQRLLLQKQNIMLEQKVSEYEPKAQYVDLILKSKGTLATSQIAADYGLSAYQLNKILNDEHIQHKIGDQWILYKEHMNLGYTKSETIHITHTNGSPDTKLNTKWTQKGRLLIHNILGNMGVYANMDKRKAG